ncbi:helix-turn-helix domain-containing protein [Candidatus Kaiserbacteria bacterium]|nr:helix-turn-helix domain-containing protein [Candidatus Kaiserbacteria bacterium]
MARREDKIKAIRLRKQGLSYSQIKEKLGVGKGTLSAWLRDMPLSRERLYELQKNEAVIEKIREAKRRTRNQRLEEVYQKVSKDLGALSERDLLIAGFFLYWGEGGKSQDYSSTFTNTDPSMIRCYLRWIELLGIPKSQISVRLHLYSDMSIRREISFWSRETGIPRRFFRKPYIKESKYSDITFTTFGHGTCDISVSGRDITEYVSQGLKRLSEMF